MAQQNEMESFKFITDFHRQKHVKFIRICVYQVNVDILWLLMLIVSKSTRKLLALYVLCLKMTGTISISVNYMETKAKTSGAFPLQGQRFIMEDIRSVFLCLATALNRFRQDNHF